MADPRGLQTLQPVAKVADSAAPPTVAEPVTPPLTETPEPVPAAVTPVPKVVHPKPIVPRQSVTSRPVSLAVASPATSYPPHEPAAVPDLPPPPEIPVTPVINTASVPPAAVQPHTVTIPEGTSLAIRLGEKLSTDHNYSGDTFRATLEAPLVVDGFIIADRGAKVLGQVVKAQKPGKMQGAAELSLTLTEIATTDGQRIHVETNQSLRKGPSNTGEEVMKMGGGAALGAIIGAIAEAAKARPSARARAVQPEQERCCWGTASRRCLKMKPG